MNDSWAFTIVLLIFCAVFVAACYFYPPAGEAVRAWYDGLTFNDVKFFAVFAFLFALLK